jgi:hypothetical protein
MKVHNGITVSLGITGLLLVIAVGCGSPQGTISPAATPGTPAATTTAATPAPAATTPAGTPPASTPPATTVPLVTTTATETPPAATPSVTSLPPLSVFPVPAAGQGFGSEAQTVINSIAGSLKNYIANSLVSLQQSAPKNPGLTTQFNTKIAMLQNPNLYDDIVKGGYFLVDSVPSTGGGKITIAAVFPAAEMRSEAWYTLQVAKMSLPVLEDFMSKAYSVTQITIYYGFVIGNTGGTGALSLEDKTTYQARWRTGMQPYDPVICHELSHAYIGHEGLNQFLEIYIYNMIAVHSSSLESWIYLRDYRTWSGEKTGYAAMLDVYKLIGLPAMQQAYRNIYQLKPPYGQPLADPCKQAFVDQSPEPLKAQVQSIVAKITY